MRSSNKSKVFKITPEVLNKLTKIFVKKIGSVFKNKNFSKNDIPDITKSYIRSCVFGQDFDFYFFIYVLNYIKNEKCSLLDYILRYNPIIDNEFVDIVESIEKLYLYYFSK
jgi:hypothetical protein